MVKPSDEIDDLKRAISQRDKMEKEMDELQNRLDSLVTDIEAMKQDLFERIRDEDLE